jgi:hypothetical protein
MTETENSQTDVNNPRTSTGIGAFLTRGRSANVLRELLVKRNLAEQSKWLNDETGDRSWAKHETQTVEWMMGRQVRTA